MTGFAAHVSHATPTEIAVGVGLAAASIGLSLAVAAFVAVRLPVDYFVTDARPLPLPGHSAGVRLAARVARNLVGACLVVVGLVLSLPGVPGQGLLTILLGVMLLDIPGKRRVERALVRRPMVHRAINAVRARWAVPAIAIPPKPPPKGRASAGP